MLNKKHLTAAAINAIMVKMLITYPHVLIEMCGNAAWINILYCTLLAVLLFGIVRSTYCGRKNIIEIAENLGGGVLRVIVGMVVMTVLTLNIMPIIRSFPELNRLVLLQGTYVEYIGIAFIITVILGAMCGTEAILRFQTIFIPVATVFFILFLILLPQSLSVDNIFPILGKGFSNIFIKGISSLSLFTDLLLLNILLPECETTSDYKSACGIAIIVSGMCAVLIMIAYGMSYPFPITEKFVVPMYQMERLIHLSNFFSRFEAIFQFVWSISIILYVCLDVSVMAKVWQQTFKLKESNPLIMPISAILVGAALVPTTFAVITKIEVMINKWLYIPVFTLLIVAGFVSRKKKNS